MDNLATKRSPQPIWSIYSMSSYLLLIVFGLSYIIFATYYFYGVIGESDDYKLPTISIQRHLSDVITEADINQARITFPEENSSWDRWKSGEGASILANGKKYTYYFPLYSAAVIPFMKLLESLNIPQGRAFPVANVFYYLSALLFLVMRLKVCDRTRFLLVASLCFNPVSMYIAWPSAEVFICSLVIYFLVNLFNGNYRLALFFSALAATLNIALVPLSGLVYFKWFQQKKRGSWTFWSLSEVVQRDISYACSLLIINSILVAPIIVNLARFGKLVPMQGMGSVDGIAGRFTAYWVDLNFGFLPFFPLFVPLILVCAFASKKRNDYVVCILALFCCALIFSFMIHINCGVTGLHRYMTWTSTALVFFTIYYLRYVPNHNLKILSSACVLASSALTGYITSYHGGLFAVYGDRASYVKMSPIARYFLDRAPQLYNPLFSTFNNRINEIDGGYSLPDHPLIYRTSNGNVKKILLTPPMITELASELCGETEGLLEQSRGEAKGYFYVNVKSDDVFICEKAGSRIRLNSPETRSKFLTSGWSYSETWGTWTDSVRATIDLTIGKDVKEIELRGRPFFAPGHILQRLIVKVNGVNAIEDVVSENEGGEHTISIPVDDSSVRSRSVRLIKLELELPDAARPRDFGVNADGRLLGFGLTSILLK